MWPLFLLGLLTRLPGLLFNGMIDLDPGVFEWGARVRQYGLAVAFDGSHGYGILSYALAGAAYVVAEFIPRFWWAPHKVMEIAFEIGILWCLIKIAPPTKSLWIMVLFWLNPWFIHHGAWLGSWDGSFTLLGLLAAVYLGRQPKENLGWWVVGVLLAAAAMLKPQGMFYFVLGILIFLAVQFVQSPRRYPLYFLAGAAGTFFAAGTYLEVGGGDAISLVRAYSFTAGYMQNLCAECVNVWRPVTRVAQFLLGQEGSTLDLHLPRALFLALDRAALVTSLGLILTYSLRMSRPSQPDSSVSLAGVIRILGGAALALFLLGLFRSSDPSQHTALHFGRYSTDYARLLLGVGISGASGLLGARPLARVAGATIRWLGKITGSPSDSTSTRPPYHAATLFMGLIVSSLVIPQLGTRAHGNHTYAALVLLIPLVARRATILIPWILLVTAHFYEELSSYALGRPQVLPTLELLNPHAQPLLERIRTASADPLADLLLRFQQRAADILTSSLPEEPYSTWLSLVAFVCVLWILRELFQRDAVIMALPPDQATNK